MTCIVAVWLFAAASVVVPSAAAADLAEAQKHLEAAKATAERLGKEIPRERARIAALQGAIAGLEGEISLAQAEYDRILAKLDATRAQLADTQARFDHERAVMNARVAETYMAGPGSTLGLLLSSSSLADLSARMEYLNALQAHNADQASRLRSLARQLSAIRARQADLVNVSKGALQMLERRRSELAVRRSDLSVSLASMQEKLAEAKRLEERWSHKVQVVLHATGGFGGPSPFDVCPVPNYSWIADDFGAPRYTTVPPHAHEGNDIGAPYGSPIVAPFAGTASNASNGLGGLAVTVQGAQGYVYNAHLSRFGTLGRVSTGDVIGYVGMSGDAQGTVPHDHLEWHPGGGAAVDPHAFLLAVC